jgi:hypothetical protein
LYSGFSPFYQPQRGGLFPKTPETRYAVCATKPRLRGGITFRRVLPMAIYNTMHTIEISREDALKTFISAVQAMPGIIPKELSGEDIIRYLFKGAEMFINFVNHGETD